MTSDAQKRATRKYRDKTYDRIEVTVPKGTRDRWRALAEQEGKSLNAFIISRIEGAYVHASGIYEDDTPETGASSADSLEPAPVPPDRL